MLLSLLVIPLLASGCTVIHSDNGKRQVDDTNTSAQWHHSFLLETIEGSDPIDPAECAHVFTNSSVNTHTGTYNQTYA